MSRAETLEVLRGRLAVAEDELERAKFIDSFARMQQVSGQARARINALRAEIAALEGKDQ